MINLNLPLQRSEPIIHIIHDQLFSTAGVLLSRFFTPDIVKRYIDKVKQLLKIQDPDNSLAQDKLFLNYLARSQIEKKNYFFFYLGFLSQTFPNHRTAEEGGGHFFNSSLPLPPTSQAIGHWPRDCCKELTYAHS